MKNKFWIPAIIIPFAFAACNKTSEETIEVKSNDEAVVEAVQEVADAVEQAAEETQEAIEEAVNEVEEAAEEAEEANIE